MWFIKKIKETISRTNFMEVTFYCSKEAIKMKEIAISERKKYYTDSSRVSSKVFDMSLVNVHLEILMF